MERLSGLMIPLSLNLCTSTIFNCFIWQTNVTALHLYEVRHVTIEHDKPHIRYSEVLLIRAHSGKTKSSLNSKLVLIATSNMQ